MDHDIKFEDIEFAINQKAPKKEKVDSKKMKEQERIETVKRFKRSCLLCGLPEPIEEYQFHPKRKWKIDYFFEKNGFKVALEVEGGVYQSGRHNRASGYLKDMQKYNNVSLQGIILIRTVPDELFGEGRLGAIPMLMRLFANLE